MKIFVQTFVGHINVFDIDVTPSLLERIKAEILEESNTPAEACLFFPETRLWNGSKLSDHVLELARAMDPSALAADGVAARPRPDQAVQAGAAETRAGGPVAAQSQAAGTAAAVGARGSARRVGGFSDLSEDGWAGHGAGSNTSDGGRPRRGAAAPKGRRADRKGRGSARSSTRGDRFEEDRGKVTVVVTQEEAKLVSEDLEFRWIAEDSIEIASFKKQAPVPRTVPGADKELPTCLLFPGEGCQYKGMCRSVHALPGVLDLMERASKVLGYDVFELCNLGPGFRLSQTRYCQPLVIVASMAALEKLKVLRPEAAARASTMAGFGVGQFTALCAAGVLGFEDVLRLVQIRAEAMEEICNGGKQLMLVCVGLPCMEEACNAGKQLVLVCVGLDARTLTEICLATEQEAGPGALCRISGHCHSKPPCYTLGGTERAVLLAKARVEKAGALMARILSTQVASETQLMAPAGTRFFAALDAALESMKPPSCTVWSSVGPRPFHAGCSPLEIVEDLKAHLTKPCLWDALTMGLKRQPVGECYELGPRSFLRSMMQRTDRELCQRLHNIMV